MNLDEVDIYIITSILDANRKKGQITFWEMARRYPWSQSEKGLFITQNDEMTFYTTKESFMERRIERLQKYGLVQIQREEYMSKKGKLNYRKKYIILGDKVKKCNHKFINKNAMALLVKDNSGKWRIFEL